MTTPPFPPYPPEPPEWQPPPEPKSTGTVIGLAFAGIALFVAANVAAALVAIVLTEEFGGDLALGIGAGGLALLAFGGGIILIVLRRPWATGLGLGLMIGWALMTVVSAGYCTGLNPGLYA